MEKEEPKFTCVAASQEQEANGVLKKNEKSISDATDAEKNAISGSQSQENGAYQNQQYTALLQRAHNPQHAGEKSTTQSTHPVMNEGVQQLQCLTNHQHQLCPQPQPFVLPAQPFWLPSRPSYQLPGTDALASFQPCIPLGATDGGWQAPAVFGTGASSRYQPQAPNLGYHVGYPTYPGFPGSCEPSFWWYQAQQSLVSGISAYPRAYGYVSSQSLPIPSCVASSGQPLLRGVIKLPEKLSQKHKKLWEAQSAENVQLWNMIGQLQVELADCKSRLIKLEAETSSLRPATEEPPLEVGNGSMTVAGQPAKRGRPKRAAQAGSQSLLRPRARARKPAVGRTKADEKPTDFGRGRLNKVDDKDKDGQSLDTTEQDRNEKIPAAIKQNNASTEINESLLTIPASLDGQVLQKLSGIQSCELDFKSSSLMKSNYEDKHSSKNVYSILSQHTGGFINYRDDSINNSGKGNSTWASGIISEDTEQNPLGIACQAFYNNGNVSRQGITSWSVENEKGVTESGLPAVGYKNENEEMAEEGSSGPEEIETQNGSWCGK